MRLFRFLDSNSSSRSQTSSTISATASSRASPPAESTLAPPSPLRSSWNLAAISTSSESNCFSILALQILFSTNQKLMTFALFPHLSLHLLNHLQLFQPLFFHRSREFLVLSSDSLHSGGESLQLPVHLNFPVSELGLKLLCRKPMSIPPQFARMEISKSR